METSSSLPKHVSVLRWVARIIGTLFVLYFLSQVFGEFSRKAYINVSHPGPYVLLAFWGLASIGLLIAWRWEGIGGFLAAFSIISSDLLHIFWVQGQKTVGAIVVSLFLLIPALLFIYCWWKTRKES